MSIIFETPHGSHLYGTATELSDRDYYVVLSKVNTNRKHYSRQRIVGNEDITTVDINAFLSFCERGVPQALEAMFSPVATYDEIGAFRSAYRAGYSNELVNRYLKTIKSFAFKAGRQKDALRLTFNLKQMYETGGRFNPQLTKPQRRAIIESTDGREPEEIYELCKSLITVK